MSDFGGPHHTGCLEYHFSFLPPPFPCQLFFFGTHTLDFLFPSLSTILALVPTLPILSADGLSTLSVALTHDIPATRFAASFYQLPLGIETGSPIEGLSKNL